MPEINEKIIRDIIICYEKEKQLMKTRHDNKKTGPNIGRYPKNHPRPDRKTCASWEILNPKTNRCVDRKSVTGKKVLSDMGIKNTKIKTCASDEILNPETNRCVKKNSIKGKKIINDMPLSKRMTL